MSSLLSSPTGRSTLYIVACTFRDRRYVRALDDKYGFVRKHLEFLSGHTGDITAVVFAFDCPVDEDEFRAVVDEYELAMPVRLLTHTMPGMSYRSWSEAIDDNIGYIFDQFFLIEDDWVPTEQNFISIFSSKLLPDTGFVCMRLSVDPNEMKHAGISSGLLPARVAKSVYAERGTVLFILPDGGYNGAENNQRWFLANITKAGYDLADIRDEASIIFPQFGDQFIEYGDASKPSIIVPLINTEEGIKEWR